MPCNTNINVPTTDNTQPECLYPVDANCVFYQDAISYLSLSEMSTAKEIIDALVTSLANARARIVVLEGIVEDFEERITALEV